MEGDRVGSQDHGGSWEAASFGRQNTCCFTERTQDLTFRQPDRDAQLTSDLSLWRMELVVCD